MPPLLPLGITLRARYKIINVIYEAKLMNVYCVQDLHIPGKVWVVKEMQMIGVESQDKGKTIKKFHQEALKISSITHQNIATIIDFFSEGTNFYVVREYIQGTDLGTILRKNQRPFAEVDVVRWSIALSDALSFLYSQKLTAIFFREFHMGNIMYMPNGEIKLIDLGLARLFQTETDADSLNRMGSMEYASPEQFSDEGIFDIRSLVYSLGAFMYHALTNVNPSSSPFDLKPINLLNPILSRGVQEVVKRSTEIDPKIRYQNLNDMKRDLISVFSSPSIIPVRKEKEKNTENSVLNWIIGFFLIVISGAIIFLIYHYFFRH